jgi:hypothetical protein
MLALYVVELVLANLVLPAPWSPYRWLAWTPALDLSIAWQPWTQFLVQGPQPFQVILNLVVVWFFLPWALDRFTRRDLLRASTLVFASIVLGGLAWWGLNVAWILGTGGAGWNLGPAMGWSPWIVALVAVYCLALPDQEIMFMFVARVQARWLYWLELALLGLYFLAMPGLQTIESLAAFGGITAWWHFIGPGAQRRRYRAAGRKVERAFTVLPGGKPGRQGGQRRPTDDTFH